MDIGPNLHDTLLCTLAVVAFCFVIWRYTR